MADAFDWSATDANNTAVGDPSVSTATGMNAANVDNALRAIMGDFARAFSTGTGTVAADWTISGAWTFTGNQTFSGSIEVGDATSTNSGVLVSSSSTTGRIQVYADNTAADSNPMLSLYDKAGNEDFRWEQSGKLVLNGTNNVTISSFSVEVGSASSGNPGIEIARSGSGGRLLVYADSAAASSTPLISVFDGGGTEIFRIEESGAGTIGTGGTAITSDERLKTQIGAAPTSWAAALAWLGAVARYRIKRRVEKDGDAAPWHLGVIAQRLVGSPLADAVRQDEHGIYSVDYDGAEAAALAAVIAEVDRLRARIADLEGR
jgi:hypothetical protein